MVDTFFRTVLKYRFIVLIAWVLLAAVIVTGLPSLQEVVNRTDTSFLPKNSDTAKAEKWINQINPDSKSKSSAVLVLSNKEGITQADRAWFYEKLTELQLNSDDYTLTEVISVKDVPTLQSQFVSKDNQLEMAQIKFEKDVISDDTQEAIAQIREAFQEGAAKNTHAYLTGAAGITVDFKKSSDEGLVKTEILTLVLVLGILLLVFRSPITPFMPLFVVALSFVVTTGLVGWAADTFGLPISSFTQSFLIAIMFGAGTDYCILLLQRFREELANGLTKEEAVLKTMHTVGKTVLYAGSTVLIAFSIIGFAALNMYASAVGVAIGIGITLLAAITLVPALFMIVGSKLFWPIKIKVGDGHHDSKLWGRMAALTNKKPILIIIVLLVAFMPLSTFFEGKRSFDDLAEIDSKFDSVKGFRLIEEKFSPGEVLPVSVGIKAEDISLRDPASLAAIGQLTTALTKVDGIEKVRSISQPAGEALPQLSLEQQQQMMQSPEFQAALSYYTSQDGMYGKMEIVLEDNPYAEKSLKEIVKIEKAIDLAVKGTALENVQIKLAGTTAAYHELDDISQEDLIRTTTLVVIGTFIVLMVMLRSIVAPIYILLSLVLNYLITMGILEWVFVDWLGNPGLSWTVSFFAFIIIVALGVDYSIFLMARVKEEYTPGNIQAAIRKAMVSTGGVIMSAAAIMSGTFAAMMFSGVLTMMQIGAAIVIGLILYTFLFMGFIVPATVRLLGDKNGWPFKF
jgi:uncharacterized membrane protein YdfJ with MMPL/SSD domain